jgi:hypothetical protein
LSIEVTFGVHDITEASITQGFRLEAYKKCELLVDLCHKFHGKPKTKYDRKSSLCLWDFRFLQRCSWGLRSAWMRRCVWVTRSKHDHWQRRRQASRSVDILVHYLTFSLLVCGMRTVWIIVNSWWGDNDTPSVYFISQASGGLWLSLVSGAVGCRLYDKFAG